MRAAFVLGRVACLVWLNEITADSVHAELAPCKHVQGFCHNASATMDYSEPMGWVSTVGYYSFRAVAAWAAAALIGRELEIGTAKLAWTQGVSPARWLAAKLALPAPALVLGGTLFVVVLRWAWSAHRDLMGDDWTFADVFAARGPALIAYGLCALAIGALTALVLRRALPALGVSMAVMIALNQYLAYHRNELRPTATRTSGTEFELSNSVWQVENGTLVGGHRVEGLDHGSLLAHEPRRDRHPPHDRRPRDRRLLPRPPAPHRSTCVRHPMPVRPSTGGWTYVFSGRLPAVCYVGPADVDAREPPPDIPHAMSP